MTHTSNKTADELIDLLTLEEQVSILAGADYWSTPAIDRLGIAKLRVTGWAQRCARQRINHWWGHSGLFSCWYRTGRNMGRGFGTPHRSSHRG
jgi:hypothetical protein